MIGKTLAHYEVLAKLGEGGMGAVYRARDVKLGREVAMKVLPDRFAQDQERLARFHREARTLAALNHPNIAAIHGLESDQGVTFLAMELAEGEDLAQRLARGPLPVDEAVAVAQAIAQGMEEAHARGVIHRDLKPANVKVSADGKVKVLDFGLARAFEGGNAVEPDPLDSPTLTAAMTGAGVILGTAAYMSPEQARGGAVDRRTDIWSFGAVLYEMLTAVRPFQGETVSDTLASILKTDPDWDALPADTPDAVRLLLVRCLERDRNRRLQDIGEARILLSDDGLKTLYSGLSFLGATSADIPADRRSRRLLPAVLLAVLAGAVLGAAALWFTRPAPPPQPRRWLEIGVADHSEEPARTPVIAPDGAKVVYERDGRLWLRRLDTGATLELPGTAGARLPFWSVDSRHLGFFQDTRIMRLDVDGGAPVMVCELKTNDYGAGGCWSPDDRILFTLGDAQGVLAVPARGGSPSTFLAPDTTTVQDLHDPYLLPDGQGLLYSAHLTRASYTRLYHERDGVGTLLFDGGKEKVLSPVWCRSGHVLFRMDGPNAGVWALPYDPASRTVLGAPFLVVSHGLWPSVSQDGTLVCATGDGHRSWQLARLDRRGEITATYGSPKDLLPFFAVDRQEGRAAITVRNEETSEIWQVDLARNTQSRLTFDDQQGSSPHWAPDGAWLLGVRGPAPNPAKFHITRISLAGLEPPLAITQGHLPTLTPDARTLVFSRYSSPTDWEIFTLDLGDAAAEPMPLFTSPGWQYGAVVSPDGRALAYVSRENGRDEVFLRRFPEADQKRLVSREGGGWPCWNAAGDRLYYMSGLHVMEVAVERGPELHLGEPSRVFTRPRGADTLDLGWPLPLQVSGDGERFYMLLETDRESSDRPLLVVQNWAR